MKQFMIGKSLEDKLAEYDWLHLHHEDFTGQYGRFYASFHNQPWYRQNQAKMEELATSLGYKESISTQTGSRKTD